MIARNKANLFIVRMNGTPINAMINFFSKDTFVPAYAAPQPEWRKYYPNDFMFWNTIAWAANQGFRTYDFGADSSYQKGLLWFKKKWGGVHYPMFYSYYLSGPQAPPNFDSSSPAYRLLRAVWANLPVSVSQHLGAWATRQLS